MSTFLPIGDHLPQAGKPLVIHTRFPRENSALPGDRVSRAYRDHDGCFHVAPLHDAVWPLERSHTVVRWKYRRED